MLPLTVQPNQTSDHNTKHDQGRFFGRELSARAINYYSLLRTAGYWFHGVPYGAAMTGESDSVAVTLSPDCNAYCSNLRAFGDFSM